MAKGLGRGKAKRAYALVLWETAQALRICFTQDAGSSISAALEAFRCAHLKAASVFTVWFWIVLI